MPEQPITIQLNGRPVEIPSTGIPLNSLLEQHGLLGKPVLVELNRIALLAAEHDQRVLQPDDVVEIIKIVAGG